MKSLQQCSGFVPTQLHSPSAVCWQSTVDIPRDYITYFERDGLTRVQSSRRTTADSGSVFNSGRTARVRAANTVVDHGTPVPSAPWVTSVTWGAEVDRRPQGCRGSEGAK